MKIKLTTASLLLLFVALFSLSNRNGRATQANRGNTGAPGDETNANGTPRTCNFCHSASNISSNVTIRLINTAGDTVSSYLPGQAYTALVRVNGAGPAQGYAFQMIALRNADTTDIDGFLDQGTNNYKLATITNGRTYAEHDNISNTDAFAVQWIAPAAGAGNVTFYAAGNAVNRNGTSSGDGASITTLQVTESPVSGTEAATGAVASLRVFPNPVAHSAQIELNLRRAGNYQLQVFDQHGRRLYFSDTYFPEGRQQWTLPSEKWQPGLYVTEITDGRERMAVKVVKI